MTGRSRHPRRDGVSPSDAEALHHDDEAYGHEAGESPRTRSEMRGRRHREVRRSVVLTALSTLLPGLGLVFTRRRALGVLLSTLAVISMGLLLYLVLNGGLIAGVGRFLTRNGLLALLALFVLGGVLWILGIMLTARETSRPGWTRGGRLVQQVFTVFMCLVVAVPAARATQFVLLTQGTLGTMFQDRYAGRGTPGATPEKGEDPWRNVPRVNFLLLGSDAGPNREGVRTDSVMVASIDTHTGDTTLVSIPRNLQKVPFPKDNPLHKLYPKGYDCGTECLMDAVWQEAEVKNRKLFPADEKRPGLDTTREVVQEVVGMSIDYTVVVDLKGFEQLVDAMGGVMMNVPQRIAIGGKVQNGVVVPGSIKGYLEPGYQKLDGYHALWYSRSRAETSDNDRMRRQRCMVNALVSQTNPFQMLQRFPDVMKVASDNISFDVPQDHLPAVATLVETMQKGNMRSVNLSPPHIKGYDPDYAKIRRLVKKAVTTPHDNAAPRSKGAGKPSPSPSSSTSAPTSSSSSSSSPEPISNTRDSC